MGTVARTQNSSVPTRVLVFGEIPLEESPLPGCDDLTSGLDGQLELSLLQRSLLLGERQLVI